MSYREDYGADITLVAFDGTMIFLAMLVLNLSHPGFMLRVRPQMQTSSQEIVALGHTGQYPSDLGPKV